MHIVYLANSRFPSERAHTAQIFHNANAFSRLGHEVDLYVTDRKNSISDSPTDYYGSDTLFNLHKVKVPDMAGRGEQMPRFLHIPALTIQRIVFAWRTAQLISRKKVDIVYSRDEWVLAFFSFFSSCNNLVYESHEAKFSWAVRRLVAKKIPLIVISEGIMSFYLKCGIPTNQILVAHDGIESSFFGTACTKEDARAFLSITESKPIVMYFGGLDAWKGVGTLCAATDTQNRFVIYVCGGTEAQIAEYSKKYPSVNFLGATKYKDLPCLQQAADVLVIPNTAHNTLSAEYTSPLKLFAFMASGVPVVASDIPSLRAILDESMAVFALADTPSDFKEKILSVISNTSVSKQRADRARCAAQEYTWEKRAKKIFSFVTST